MVEAPAVDDPDRGSPLNAQNLIALLVAAPHTLRRSLRCLTEQIRRVGSGHK